MNQQLGRWRRQKENLAPRMAHLTLTLLLVFNNVLWKMPVADDDAALTNTSTVDVYDVFLGVFIWSALPLLKRN